MFCLKWAYKTRVINFATGGEHTRSELSTSISSAEEPAVDDDTLAQKLGMGTVETSQGKCRSLSLV